MCALKARLGRAIGFKHSVSGYSPPAPCIECHRAAELALGAGRDREGRPAVEPRAAAPPPVLTLDGWHYFTPSEAATVEALVDRLIPPDPQTPGGKDCGCAVFIDRQLAGPYGRNEAFYMTGPF
jgi:gluconate 2-dehydrogenase gamma chain